MSKGCYNVIYWNSDWHHLQMPYYAEPKKETFAMICQIQYVAGYTNLQAALSVQICALPFIQSKETEHKL